MLFLEEIRYITLWGLRASSSVLRGCERPFLCQYQQQQAPPAAAGTAGCCDCCCCLSAADRCFILESSWELLFQICHSSPCLWHPSDAGWEGEKEEWGREGGIMISWSSVGHNMKKGNVPRCCWWIERRDGGTDAVGSPSLLSTPPLLPGGGGRGGGGGNMWGKPWLLQGASGWPVPLPAQGCGWGDTAATRLQVGEVDGTDGKLKCSSCSSEF